MSEQPRPGGSQWWCPICLELVEAVVTPADTETMLTDEARCPDPEGKHGGETTLIGTVATERITTTPTTMAVTERIV